MKKLYFVFVLFFAIGSLQAQDEAKLNCSKTCTVDKQIGEGVFLGVQISSIRTPNATKVVSVVEDTQAEKMGIKEGDVIQTINGVQMKHQKFMVEWVGLQKAGMDVVVSLEREGKPMTLKGELGFKTVTTVTETICCDEDLGKLKLAELQLYPNPSRGEFNLSFEGATNQPYQLKVVSVGGSVVFENTVNPNGKSVQEYIQTNIKQSGKYIVWIGQNGESIQRKLVITK